MNDKVYVIGGYDYSPLSTIYVYDPAQATRGWLWVGNLPTSLYELAAASVGGNIYTIGGYNDYTGCQSTVYGGSFGTGVVPSSGPLIGGNMVTISGINLGNGDVTNVTLSGIAATILADNSPTQVVVSAGASVIPVNGDVMVNSTSYSVTVKSNAYTYLPLVPAALPATVPTVNGFYANWNSVIGATNYLLDVSATSNFIPCVGGYTNLGVGNVTTFWVNGLSAGTMYYYRVRCQQNGVSSDNSQTNSVTTLNGGMSVSNGPVAGGNTLTITGIGLGNGSDITNVTIRGAAAVIQSQTADSVTVMVGAGQVGAGDNATGDVQIYSASRGVTTFVNGYTYNQPGTILGSFTGWLSVSNLPATRADLAAASVNGKIYAIGGDNDTSPSVYSNVYVYDPSHATPGWLSVSNLPMACARLAAASVNGKIYAIGEGINRGNYYSPVYVYDPSQPTLGWLSVSNLPAPRSGLAAASANGKIYAIGGYYNYSIWSTVYVYDPAQPTQGWLSVSNLPAGREFLAAASVNGKIYAIGGNGSSVCVYDPAQPTLGWLSVSNLPAVSENLAAVSVNGKIYAIGGDDGFHAQSTVYVYDPLQPTLGWLSASNLPVLRSRLAAASVNDKIYAIGGYNENVGYRSTVYEGSFATGVVPSSGSLAGGDVVTISGSYLGVGDVTSVRFCGIPATILADNSPTQVVVVTAAGTIATNGDVMVNSTGYGVAVKSNAYTYLPQAPNALAASNITLNSFYANWSSVSGATNYLFDVSTTSNFVSCVVGYTNLSVGNVTTFCVTGLNAGATYYYRVRCQQNGLTSGSSSANSVQTLGTISLNNGPAAGGNTLTITGLGLGNGSDITNVVICGIAAVIQSQTADSVTVVVSAGASGTGDIKVYSVSPGVTTFVSAYTYNPRGVIMGPLSWSSVSNLPAASGHLAAASLNGKIYAIGGVGGGYLSTVYVYDPTQASLGWLTVSNLPAALYGLAAASANGKIYAIGGYDGSSDQPTVFVYDPLQPTQGWLSASNLPAKRENLAVASMNGKVYAIGGYNDSTGYQSTVYVYDPAQPSQGWLSVSNLPAARSGLAAASVNGKIYAIGGSSGVIQSTVFVYDPLQPSLGWLSVSNLPAVRSSFAAASVNGKIYAMGGYSSASPYSQSTVYIYDPSQPTQGWLSVSNLSATRYELAAASVNGKIYAIGGENDTSPYFYSTVFEGSFAPDVVPSSGPLSGGNTVSINGINLGNGDVTGVALCGIPATILSDNSPTQIVVRAGSAAIPVIGDVVVNSTSYGITVKSNGYTYLQLPTITTITAFAGTPQLQLSWPTNCLGWELQAQTNPLGAGLGTNWFQVANSTTTNQLLIPINPANANVFYRLHGL